MGYVIRYGKKIPQESGNGIRKCSGSVGFAMVLVTAAVLIRLFIPQSGAYIRRMLIPGMPDSAAASFSEMLENLRGGMEIGDAVDVFCHEIFENENS